MVLAGVAFALTLTAYHLVHPSVGDCPISEIWRGTLLAVVSLATAISGLLCGGVGMCGRRVNRHLCALGLLLNGAFLVLFGVLWLSM